MSNNRKMNLGYESGKALRLEDAKGRYLENSNDSLKLVNCRITNSVRCVPPQNKPNIDERNICRKFYDCYPGL